MALLAVPTFTFNKALLPHFSGGGDVKPKTRRFSQPMTTRCCSFPEFKRHADKMYEYLSPSLVRIRSSFSDKSESYYAGAGVFLEPTLILTSAHLAGRVTVSYKSESPNERDPFVFNHDCLVHRSLFAETTVAVTRDLRTLRTTPVAVNYASNVAVLKVVAVAAAATPPPPETTTPCQHHSMAKFKPFPPLPFPHYTMANFSPKRGDCIMVMMDLRSMHFGYLAGHVRAAHGERTFKVRAPWPLKNDLWWIEFDLTGQRFNSGHPTPSRNYYNTKNDLEVSGSMTMITGSPLFNNDGELIGVASWEFREKGAPYPVAFAAPMSAVREVVKYAKTKKPEDPIAMDAWIK
ncbi:hypothetical protein ACP275_10G048100 [Erythranthe tilingii]